MTSTRILILGVLLDGPLHGYKVRRRLELWGADSWASVAYGSIYHGLAKMADEGLLEVVEGGRGGKTVYAITDDGRAEFYHRLFRAWMDISPIVDPFQVAMTFMDRMPQAELLRAMQARSEQLRLTISMMERSLGGKQGFGAPRHIDENLKLITGQLRAQLDWLDETIPKVKAGDLP
ncbi:PadR family transcriptional regulator [Microtetraspora sp. NBRC 13810]|uniref:PadR family transcriptional regulator n=1 Tax=Microtetraspora sp. NBRC 13810 TaxID=3030990 RepID=UPI00255441A1|nr:PadR family transcriptional regulator [Microtetraspora sp. NBRC 13810]